MRKGYSIRVHPLPEGYRYIDYGLEDSYPYFVAEAIDGRIHIRQPETEGEGFCDCYGSIVVPCIYDRVRPYSCGISVVRNDVRRKGARRDGIRWLHGGIDMQGKVVIPIRYEWLGDFVEGFAPACDGGKWGILDSTGADATPFCYDKIVSHLEELPSGRWRDEPYVAKLNGKFGCLAWNGDVVAPFVHDNPYSAYHAGYDALYEEFGEIVPPSPRAFPYESLKLGPFSFVRAEFPRPTMPDYHRILTADGDADILPVEEYERRMREYEEAQQEGRLGLGLADEQGNVVLSPEYRDVEYARGEGPKGMTARKGDRWYFIELIYPDLT